MTPLLTRKRGPQRQGHAATSFGATEQRILLFWIYFSERIIESGRLIPHCYRTVYYRMFTSWFYRMFYVILVLRNRMFYGAGVYLHF